MVGQVADGVRVGFGLVIQHQDVVVGQGVGNGDGQIAGVAFLAVGADIGELQAAAAGFCGPDLFVKAAFAAVKVIPLVVSEKFILLAVQGEFRAADAVAVAADERAQVFVALFIIRQRIVAQHHVDEFPIPVGDHEKLHGAAVSENPRLCGAVVQDVPFHRLAGSGDAERLL